MAWVQAKQGAAISTSTIRKCNNLAICINYTPEFTLFQELWRVKYSNELLYQCFTVLLAGYLCAAIAVTTFHTY